MRRPHHLIYLWGKGGYFALQRNKDGTVSVPEGERAWKAFAHHAPMPLLLAAWHTLELHSEATQ